VGATERLTVTRRPWVPAAEILAELERWHSQWREAGSPPLDCVTLGGAGEPCLNSEMAEVIRGVREIVPGTDVAVLTNSTLMPDPRVRAELALADVVLPSLDSLVPAEFAALNRSHPKVRLDDVAEALVEFRGEFPGRIYLEMLLAAGINDSTENMQLMREYLQRLGPDRVDVVTLSRPGTSELARAVDDAMLQRWRDALGHGRGPAGPQPSKSAFRLQPQDAQAAAEAVLASLRRRPQTAPQLAEGLAMPPDIVQKVLETLAKEGHIHSDGSADGLAFYRPGPATPQTSPKEGAQ
jgi:hypothetical protein